MLRGRSHVDYVYLICKSVTAYLIGNNIDVGLGAESPDLILHVDLSLSRCHIQVVSDLPPTKLNTRPLRRTV